MDHEDSYPLRSRRHRCSPPQARWEDKWSCGSPCSRSSEDLTKNLAQGTEEGRLEFAPSEVQLPPPSGTLVGREAVLDHSRQGTVFSSKQVPIYDLSPVIQVSANKSPKRPKAPQSQVDGPAFVCLSNVRSLVFQRATNVTLLEGRTISSVLQSRLAIIFGPQLPPSATVH